MTRQVSVAEKRTLHAAKASKKPGFSPQRYIVCGRVRPQPYWLKESPKGEALLTSEGVSLSVLTRREAPC